MTGPEAIGELDLLFLTGVVFVYCLAYRWKYGTPKQQTPKGYDWTPNPNYVATQVIRELSSRKKQSREEKQLAPGQRVFIPIPLGNEAPMVEIPVHEIKGRVRECETTVRLVGRG